MVRCLREEVQDYMSVIRLSFNKRMRALLLCISVTLVGCLGVFGLCLAVVFAMGWVSCYLPSDIKFYVKIVKRMSRAWDDALMEADIAPVEGQVMDVPKTTRNRFACKLAIRAIARVGLLKATRANSLVYQKVILDDMQVLKVRHSDRVRVLPLAILACLDRPEEVQKVERCFEHLYTSSTA